MRKITMSALKAQSVPEAQALCGEIRSFLVDKVSKTGGHLASNLGVVEISVAIARAFNLPEDKVIYDTGHQCYVHKILTGRAEQFDSLRSLGGISGFPRREESVYDAFGTGHSGTGITAALGFAKAARLSGDKSWTVAVIGDGALTGGMVFEALNNISREDRLIIILNDNGMSISKSVGVLKKSLNQMRTAGYYRVKTGVRDTLVRIPVLGEGLARALKGAKDAVKRTVLPANNLFELYGLHYFGPADGNNLETVEFLLSEAKKKDHPSIIHLCTKKGRGYAPAEQNPTAFHGISAGKNPCAGSEECFSRAFGRILTELAAHDARIVAITAAMSEGVGLTDFARRYPSRLFDVGIAEEHAMTFAASLACTGLKPCFAVYSTFFQRAFDQLFHDAALQRLPVTVVLDRAGLSGADGATHHGLYDLALALPVPGVEIFAPCTYEELRRALESGFASATHPTLIRYPKGTESALVKSEFPCTDEIEKKIYGNGKNCAIITFGRTSEEAIKAAKELEARGIGVTVIRFFKLKGFSEEAFSAVFDSLDVSAILFVEEGVKAGSFAEGLCCRFAESGAFAAAKKKILAVNDTFVPHGSPKELLALCGLDQENIIKEILNFEKN